MWGLVAQLGLLTLLLAKLSLLTKLWLTGLGPLETTLLLAELLLTGLQGLEATLLLLPELALLLAHLRSKERATKGIRVVDRCDRTDLQLHKQKPPATPIAMENSTSMYAAKLALTYSMESARMN